MQPLLIRLSDQERVTLDRLVAEGRGSRAAVIREALMIFANRREPRDPVRDQKLHDLSTAYAKVGVSLNQIARRLNADGGLDEAVLGEALARLIALNDATRHELRAKSREHAEGSGRQRPQALRDRELRT
jgi:hypothetical protein